MGQDRPQWAEASATFRTQGGLTEEGRRILAGGEPAGPTTRISWRLPAPAGARFTDDDAGRLAGVRVEGLSIDFGGVAQKCGPGVILGARVIEDGAAMWITYEG